MEAFTIRNAKEADFEELYAFVFDKPDRNVMKRSRDNVRKMIADGVFFIAIHEKTNRIVGSCYLRAESPAESEFGGAYVDGKYRDYGLFRMLGLAAIISHFLGQPGIPLIAHVVSGNPKPVNALKSLMFKWVEGPKAYHKDIFLGGADHMEVDAEGNIYGDTYLFEQGKLIQLAREAEDFDGRVDGKAGQSHITVDLPTFDKEVLRDFRRSLEPKK